jgi:hypothetical protein
MTNAGRYDPRVHFGCRIAYVAVLPENDTHENAEYQDRGCDCCRKKAGDEMPEQKDTDSGS